MLQLLTNKEYFMPNTQKLNEHRHRKKKKKSSNSYYRPKGDSKLLSMAIDDLGLKNRTLDILKKGNIHTVNDLLIYRENELYRIQNFNKKNLYEVVNKIKGLGLAFRPEFDEKIKTLNNKADRIKVYSNGKIDDKNNKGKVNNRNLYKNINRKRKSMYECSALVGKKLKLKHTEYKEEKLSKDSLIKYKRNNKYGFKDLKGKIIIPPIYDEVFNFSENLACVEKDNKYGYIDRNNNLVIPYNYDLAMSFSEGLACVSIGEKSGYIDNNGNIVIDIKYDAATSFSNNTSRVKIDDKWGILNKDGSLKML